MSEQEAESGIQLHLKYIGITSTELKLLREFRPVVEANADFLVKRFYDQLIAFEGTRKFLENEEMLKRLLLAQRAYLLSIFDAQFDAGYYQQRRTIGQTHFRIGLDFQWYIGAYALYLELLQGLIYKHFDLGDTRIPATMNAVRKAALLDMTIVLEAYHEGDKAALQSTQAQVLHQEKLATVGLLASGLAHEIGNPLASILAICDNQLRRKDGGAISLEKFERIKQLVLRVSGIVRQLVTFAKPDPAKWQPVQVNEVIHSALDVAKLSRASKSAEIKLDLATDLPQTIGIPDQLAQVFLNLLLNAFDALRESSGELKVRSTHRDGWIHVEVQDNGCGIPSTAQRMLFAPFFTTKEPGKGTGLGLHVSLGIASSHGGNIDVRSEQNQGSTFTVRLPVREKAPEPERQT